MRKTVIKRLKKEATKNHSFKQLKKEYKAMKQKTGDPKDKPEPRKTGQKLRMVKRKLGNKTITTIKAA